MSEAQSPVTLIVKAPNQQIEDHTVECELSWTVRRLKSHLSDVYPNHPRTHEQRLIYSGHLLNDRSTLGEVLRTTDGQKQHTVHLVCTSQSPVSITNVRASPPNGLRRRTLDSSVSRTTSSESVSRENASSPSVNSSSPSVNSTSSSTSSNFDVRQIGNAFFPGAFLPHPANPHTDSSTSMDTSINSYLAQGPDLQNMQTQYVAWVQQAYAQYMMQYMQFMVANGGQTAGVEWPDMANFAAAQANSNGSSDTERYAQANGAAPQREPVARQDDNGNDDELGNRRDWLEWMYFMFRIVVLFMLVYAYSSPLRFAVVAVLGIFIYLYQRGHFRLPPEVDNPNAIRVPDNNNEPNVVDAAQQAGAHQNTQGPPAPAVDETVADAVATEAVATEAVATEAVATEAVANEAAANNPVNTAASGSTPVPAEAARPPLLALTWAFFTCFFTSIVPERAVIP